MRRKIAVGDLHGNWDYLIWKIRQTKLDNVDFIQVGDFGVGFKSKKVEADNLTRLNDELKKTDNTLYVIRGNHDDPSYFDGSKDLSVYDKIIFMSDYSNIGLSEFVVGGAISIDRSKRVENLERTPYFNGEDVKENNSYINLKLNKHVETLFIHAAPYSVFKDMCEKDITLKLGDEVNKYSKSDVFLVGDLRKEQLILEQLIRNLPKLKNIYLGHYHKTLSGEIEVDGRKINYDVLSEGELKLL